MSKYFSGMSKVRRKRLKCQMSKPLPPSPLSAAIRRASDIIKDVRTKFETSDIRLLDSLCDVNTERRNDVRQKYSKWLWRKNPV